MLYMLPYQNIMLAWASCIMFAHGSKLKNLSSIHNQFFVRLAAYFKTWTEVQDKDCLYKKYKMWRPPNFQITSTSPKA